jgi:GTP pyrophosphokinase
MHDTLVSEVCENYTGDPFAYERSLIDVISLLAEVEADWEMAAVAALRGMKTGKKIQLEQIRKKFDASISQLYEGTLQLDSISLTVERGDVQKASAVRRIDLSRILIAMVDDARVIVIHLAELLVHMREAKELPEPARQSLAKQILSIYTPLANKLGIWRMKWELEDLSFKYLNRLEFDRIARQLDERRIEREGYIQKFVGQLNSLMVRSKIQAKVNGRAKHIYGIWRKLNQKGVNFDHIFDVRAVRILVDDIASCYAALGAVHASWTSVAGEFDDYIAMPKSNGYRSLHTAVFGPDSKVVEVQIRTVEMHNDCEFGVSAHWKYKESAI